MSRGLQPDALGPWSVIVGEAVEGARPVVSAYGPMPREAACGLLEVLGLCAFDEPLVPFRTSLEVDGVPTVVVVSFGREAALALLLSDRHAGIDPDERWVDADRQLAECRAAGLPSAYE